MRQSWGTSQARLFQNMQSQNLAAAQNSVAALQGPSKIKALGVAANLMVKRLRPDIPRTPKQYLNQPQTLAPDSGMDQGQVPGPDATIT